jgi:N-acetylmuramoyl-L-alanine amidase
MVHELPSPYGSPHRSSRKGKAITAIIIHDTGAREVAGSLAWFGKPESRVSAHVVIDRDGTVYRVVPDAQAAWHAGAAQLHGEITVNAFSLGVELVDVDGGTPEPRYTPAQLQAAAQWCAERCVTYGIPLNRIVGHDAVATPHGRKVDPGQDFPWATFLLAVAHWIESKAPAMEPLPVV